MNRILFAAVMLLASFASAEEVFVINGRVSKDSPLIAIAKLPPATYTIQVFSDNSDPVTLTITIQGGSVTPIPTPTPPAPPGPQPATTLRTRVEQLAATLEQSERLAIADNYAKIAASIKAGKVATLSLAQSLIVEANRQTPHDSERWKPLADYLKSVEVTTLGEVGNAFEQIAAGLRGGK